VPGCGYNATQTGSLARHKLTHRTAVVISVVRL